jgi:hypothetical protein
MVPEVYSWVFFAIRNTEIRGGADGHQLWFYVHWFQFILRFWIGVDLIDFKCAASYLRITYEPFPKKRLLH